MSDKYLKPVTKKKKRVTFESLISSILHKSIERFAIKDFSNLGVGKNVEHIADLRPDFIFMRYERHDDGHMLLLRHVLDYSTNTIFCAPKNRVKHFKEDEIRKNEVYVQIEYDGDLRVKKYKTHGVKSLSHLRSSLRRFSVLLEGCQIHLWEEGA